MTFKNWRLWTCSSWIRERLFHCNSTFCFIAVFFFTFQMASLFQRRQNADLYGRILVCNVTKEGKREGDAAETCWKAEIKFFMLKLWVLLQAFLAEHSQGKEDSRSGFARLQPRRLPTNLQQRPHWDDDWLTGLWKLFFFL